MEALKQKNREEDIINEVYIENKNVNLTPRIANTKEYLNP